MIYCFRKDNGELSELTEPKDAVWVNLYPPFEHGELDRVADALNIPLDFLTDSLDVDERSRYEKDEETILILISSPVLNDDDRENEAIYLTIPIGIILTEDKIVSRSGNPGTRFSSIYLRATVLQKL